MTPCLAHRVAEVRQQFVRQHSATRAVADAYPFDRAVTTHDEGSGRRDIVAKQVEQAIAVDDLVVGVRDNRERRLSEGCHVHRIFDSVYADCYQLRVEVADLRIRGRQLPELVTADASEVPSVEYDRHGIVVLGQACEIDGAAARGWSVEPRRLVADREARAC